MTIVKEYKRHRKPYDYQEEWNCGIFYAVLLKEIVGFAFFDIPFGFLIEIIWKHKKEKQAQ